MPILLQSIRIYICIREFKQENSGSFISFVNKCTYIKILWIWHHVSYHFYYTHIINNRIAIFLIDYMSHRETFITDTACSFSIIPFIQHFYGFSYILRFSHLPSQFSAHLFYYKLLITFSSHSVVCFDSREFVGLQGTDHSEFRRERYVM